MLKTLNKNSIRAEIGELGEEFIHKRIPRSIRSDYYFDDQKDGIIGGKTYEVKTLKYMAKTNGFWIDPNQYQKLDTVDYIFFISIPDKQYPYFRSDLLCQVFASIKPHKYNIIKFEKTKTEKRNYNIKNLKAGWVLDQETSNKIIELSYLLH